MKLKIAILEIAIILGICGSALVLPRSFPLSWFLEISFGIFLLANLVLYNALSKRRTNGAGYKLGPRAYLGLALIVIYWMVVLLRR
jgi:hypothetical protein